jgi:hypothetical protein
MFKANLYKQYSKCIADMLDVGAGSLHGAVSIFFEYYRF